VKPREEGSESSTQQSGVVRPRPTFESLKRKEKKKRRRGSLRGKRGKRLPYSPYPGGNVRRSAIPLKKKRRILSVSTKGEKRKKACLNRKILVGGGGKKIQKKGRSKSFCFRRPEREKKIWRLGRKKNILEPKEETGLKGELSLDWLVNPYQEGEKDVGRHACSQKKPASNSTAKKRGFLQEINLSRTVSATRYKEERESRNV